MDWIVLAQDRENWLAVFNKVMNILLPKFFIHQQMHCLLILENTKIYTKTYTKIAPACFGLRPSSGSLHLSLAKFTLMLKQL
jgi:hypothetical protein